MREFGSGWAAVFDIGWSVGLRSNGSTHRHPFMVDMSTRAHQIEICGVRGTIEQHPEAISAWLARFIVEPNSKQCLVNPIPFNYLPVTNLGPKSPLVVAHRGLKVVHGDRYMVNLS